MKTSPCIRVAIAGLGAVGLPVADTLLKGGISGMQLAAVSASSATSAAAKLQRLGSTTQVPCLPATELATVADVIVEALPPTQFREVAEPTLAAGRTLVALSVTQVLKHHDLVALAASRGGRIVIPTGALCGLDAVRAAAEGGNVRSVVMETRKPPASLANAPFVVEQGLTLSDLAEPLRLYSGSVTDAAQRFPANVNVAVALALAGIGPDRTVYELWADPTVERNTHCFSVLSDESNFDVRIAGVPSATNPATGALTPLSTIATLRGLVDPLRVGT
jgi:aspartate dehydrogenase